MLHGYIPPQRFFPYLTWMEIADMPDKENVVLLLPIGAIEQHGPHLPLSVDITITTAVLGRSLMHLKPNIPAYALAPLSYGKSNEHWHFPGTVTLSATTLLNQIMEIGDSLYRAGFRKLALVNGHGGQPQVLEIAARDLHQTFSDLLVFPLFIWNVPNQVAKMLEPKELELGIHAGDAETSVMLAMLPECVQMDKAIAEYPQGLPKSSALSMEGKLPFAWVTQDLSKSGVLGNPLGATAERGEQMWRSLAEGWEQVIEDIYHFQQPQAHTSDS